LKKILLDAIAYIMAGNDIKVQVEKSHKERRGQRGPETAGPRVIEIRTTWT
jgi:hypothetical protein